MSLSRVTRAFRTSSLRASLQFGGVSTQRIGLTTTLTTDLFGASPSTTIVGTKVLPVSNPLSYRYFTSIDSSSDSQFQPIIKKKDDHSEEMEQMLSEIKEVVTNNDIVLFMKGTPDHPNCGFSYRVVQVLAKLNVSYESCNVLENPLLREGIKVYSDWPTIPQLYVKGEFIGGADIVTSMYASGELQELLGIPKPEPQPTTTTPSASSTSASTTTTATAEAAKQ